MSDSNHFFEGYSRSKDTLATIAAKITSATISVPWTIKSQGVIAGPILSHNVSSGTTYTSYDYTGKPYICLRRQMWDGRIYNILFIDQWNTTTNNIYGSLLVCSSFNDGIDIPGLKITGKVPDRTYDVGVSFRPMAYHSSQVADTDGLPQFSWHWIYVDEDTLFLSLYGNVGAAGSATTDSSYLFFGKAKPVDETKFKDSVVFVASSATHGIHLSDSCIEDYIYPNEAPFDLETMFAKKSFIDVIDANSSVSNPDNIFSNKYIITTPKLFQALKDSYGAIQQHNMLTHLVGDQKFFFCQPGNEMLRRGDIITLDSTGCDYVFLRVAARTEFYNNILMKRMESVTNLTAAATSGKITLSWKNPKRFYGVKITRNSTGYPTTHNDGVSVCNKNINEDLVAEGTATFDDVTVSSGTTYYYVAFAYSSSGIYSAPVGSAKISAVSL